MESRFQRKSFSKSVWTLPEFFKSEEELRKIWSNPMTRKALLEKLQMPDTAKTNLTTLQKLINAEKSDLFDVLEYISFAIKPITREERVARGAVKYICLVEQQTERVSGICAVQIH